MSDFISRQQAQKLLGCDKDTMMRLLRSGELETSRKENGGWLVSYDSLEKYMATTWTIREDNVGALQKIIAELKAENQHLKALLDENGISYNAEASILPTRQPIQKDADITIIDLHIPNRAIVALERNGVYTIEQLRRMTRKDLLALDGIGKKAANAIQSQLTLHGLALRKY